MMVDISFGRILYKTRNSITDIHTDNAFVCVSKQEIRNIQRDFQLHTVHVVNIGKLWVRNIQILVEKNPGLYSKNKLKVNRI